MLFLVKKTRLGADDEQERFENYMQSSMKTLLSKMDRVLDSVSPVTSKSGQKNENMAFYEPQDLSHRSQA